MSVTDVDCNTPLASKSGSAPSASPEKWNKSERDQVIIRTFPGSQPFISLLLPLPVKPALEKESFCLLLSARAVVVSKRVRKNQCKCKYNSQVTSSVLLVVILVLELPWY